MKLFFCILSIIGFLSSCSKVYIQIFDTATTNTKADTDFWVYENDSIKVTYEFWTEKGVMSFSVYNKLDKPIYIDWKNCSFIYNSNKLNYWVDEQQSTLVSYYGGYFYDGPLIKPGYTVNDGVQRSASTVVKPERITFIPPHSFYYRSQFYLLPRDYYKMNSETASKTVVKRNDNPRKLTTIYEQNFDISNTPLKVRNYLAFSFTENDANYFYVDNEFYLSSVKEMEYTHFLGETVTDNEGHAHHTKPFKKNTSFYIKIDNTKSLGYEHRYNSSKL